MKRTIGVILSCALLLTAFCGCSSVQNEDGGVETPKSESAPPPAKPLVVFYPEWLEGRTSTGRVFRTAARIFTERYGIEVEIYPSPPWQDLMDSGDVAGTLTSFKTKMAAEIMSGKGPDVFLDEPGLFYSGFDDFYKKMDAGYFLDLNEFIDNDPEFDINEFESVIMDAGLHRGKRYVMPLSYQVAALLTTEEKLARFGFSSEDFSTLKRFLTSWETLHTQFKRLTVPGDQAWVLTYAGGWFDECLDFETGKADLDNPSFKRLIELMKAEAIIQKQSYELPLAEFIDPDRDKDAIETARDSGLFEIANVGVVSYIGELSDNFPGMPEDVVMLPIPNAFGNAAATIDDYCMVSSQSENKQAAWDFVKILLSEEMQKELWGYPVRSRGTPVRKGCAENYIDTIVEDYEKRYNDRAMDIDPDRFKIAALRLVTSFDNAVIPDTKGILVWQNMGSYFYPPEGTEADFEKTKAEAENYFKIYLSE